MQHNLNHLVAQAAAQDRARQQRHRRDHLARRGRPQARANAARALATTAKRLDHQAARRAVA